MLMTVLLLSTTVVTVGAESGFLDDREGFLYCCIFGATQDISHLLPECDVRHKFCPRGIGCGGMCHTALRVRPAAELSLPLFAGRPI
jgi:hypothetical protein